LGIKANPMLNLKVPESFIEETPSIRVSESQKFEKEGEPLSRTFDLIG